MVKGCFILLDSSVSIYCMFAERRFLPLDEAIASRAAGSDGRGRKRVWSQLHNTKERVRDRHYVSTGS